MHSYRLLLLAILLAPELLLANEAHDLLVGMSGEKKATALAYIVQSSGEKCGHVTRTFYQGADKKGNAIWNAACSNGRSYSVMIYNDANGSTGALDCKSLKVVSKVDCFKKF